MTNDSMDSMLCDYFFVHADQQQEHFTFVSRLQNLIGESMDSLPQAIIKRGISFLDTATSWCNIETPIAEPLDSCKTVVESLSCMCERSGVLLLGR